MIVGADIATRRGAAAGEGPDAPRGPEPQPESESPAGILRLALEAIPHALCMFDADGRLTVANGNFAALYGLPAELLRPGTRAEVLLAARDRSSDGRPLGAVLGRLAAEGQVDHVAEGTDGRVIAIEHRPVPGGGWIETHRNITARVGTEGRLGDTRALPVAATAETERHATELQHAHDRLREAFEAVPVGLVMLDAEDRYVLWNRRYAETFVRDEDQLGSGTTFEEQLRAGLRRGEYADAVGREEEWLAARLVRHHNPGESHEQLLQDGRWIRVKETRTADGGSIGVRIDVTAMKRREDSFRLLFEANPLPMFVIDRADLRVLAVNAAAVRCYGFGRDAFLTMTLLSMLAPAEHGAARDAIALAGLPDREERIWTHLRADGSTLQARHFASALDYEGHDAVLKAVLEVSEIERVERELARTRAFLDSVVESIPLSVFVKDMGDDGRYILVNQKGEELIGYRRDQLIGRTDLDLFAPEAAAVYRGQDRVVMASGDPRVFEERVTWGDRTVAPTVTTRKLPIPDRGGGAPRYLLGIQEDVTDRRLIENRMAHMAHHDALTDLANRTLFHERLQAAAERAGATGQDHAVLWVDLDRFKEVNDTMGHGVGDGLLVAAAGRLRRAVRDTDTVARLGGDEFAVLQTPIAGAADAEALAARLVETLQAPYWIEGREVTISASVGVALSSGSAHDPDGLLRHADAALYAAKAEGRSRFATVADLPGGCSPDAAQPTLRRALERDELELHYQPIMAVGGGAVLGCEALIRWRDPARGLVSPAEFLPLAEQTGLIVPIGRWVVERACREAAAWPDHMRITVNVSAAQVRSGHLVETVEAALAAAGLDPRRLELEITESVLLDASDSNLACLRRLRDLGVGLALDDFGTGYSSLAYLRAFSFDRLKIDRSFVRDLGGSEECLSIVRAIVGLGSSFRARTTAEGVETSEQLRILRAAGCDEAQGFLFGRPMPAEDVRGLLLPHMAA